MNGSALVEYFMHRRCRLVQNFSWKFFGKIVKIYEHRQIHENCNFSQIFMKLHELPSTLKVRPHFNLATTFSSEKMSKALNLSKIKSY